MRVLGVDPGLRITGYACLDGIGEQPTLVEAGVLRLGKAPSLDLPPPTLLPRPRRTGPSAASVSARLDELDRDFRELLDRLRPRVVAVESVFAHYKHPATAIVMGHARGVLLLAIRQAGVQLCEYKPNEVKKSLTGHGHAAKDQMQRAVQARFSLAALPDPPDMADAIAIALCACRRLSIAGSMV